MERCALCPGINKPLPADGSMREGILLIGEAPGRNEDRKGRVFVGKTGVELDKHYLPVAGLRRENVLVANAIACLPPGPDGKLDPKSVKDRAMLESCMQCHLLPLIERTKPRLIVPMGNFAMKALDIEVSLDLQHGIPISTAFGTAFPMYHPAGGIHTPKSMLHIRTDWHRLRQYLLGKLRIPTDPHPSPDYKEVQDASEFEELDPTKPLGCDTESKRGGEPFCLTYSNKARTGRLIRASRLDLLEAFQRVINTWESILLWHNWLYDGAVVKKMGLKFPDRRIVDTMVRAFHLGNLSQGLKALGYRELGMAMSDFDDLVTPYSGPLVLDYYREAFLEDWPKPEEELVRDSAGKWKIYRPQSFGTKLKRFFTDHSKNPDKDPFEMWTKNWVEQHQAVQEKMGRPWPGKCVSHVPFEEVLMYATRDADALVRLWPVLQYMTSRVRKRPQERWGEREAA